MKGKFYKFELFLAKYSYELLILYRIFSVPHYETVVIDQSLMLNRRKLDETNSGDGIFIYYF